MEKLSTSSNWPVYGHEATRAIEKNLQARSATPLMQSAGLAAARLAMALAPHAQRIWVAAGPGNNGGDGLEAALHLQRWGKSVQVSMINAKSGRPPQAQAAWLRAQAEGIQLTHELPSLWLNQMSPLDLCIDALLGIGSNRPLSPEMQNWVKAMNASKAPVLAIDCPTGLDPETGQALKNAGEAPLFVCAHHTLTFITAKPGLFMGHGRDACGKIWLDNLDRNPADCTETPQAWLNRPSPRPGKTHASHKGSHGDVAVIGGESMSKSGLGMTGAAVLAATAALYAGAGRVFLSLLSDQTTHGLPPDLMQRAWQTLDLEQLYVVCGCGGGQSIGDVMPQVLLRSAHLVVDADGLNAIAKDEALQSLLAQRANTQATVITPHPLEAARLLKCTTADVQSNRLKAAQELALLFKCTVVLKGSGTVIAAPNQTLRINTSGNGLLAIGGTGDVLAGLIAARMAQGLEAFEAACLATAQHGQVANDWPEAQALTASRLANQLF